MIERWQAEVDRILGALTPALQEGWAAAHLPGDLSANDPYIKTNLALTRNLLVRIPDDTHALIVATILDGVNKGEDNDAIARRVDDVLTFTGSENWDSRAQLIARTETTRHYNSSLLAHAMSVQRQDSTPLYKSWETRTDGKEREAHKLAVKRKRALTQLRTAKWWQSTAPIKDELWRLDALQLDLDDQIGRFQIGA